MNCIFNKKTIFVILCLLLCFEISSQSSQTNTESLHFDMSGFPQWSKDLRRAEIVAFGSFPFAFFFTGFIYDSYRFTANGLNARYAPWPFTPANAVEKTQGELLTVVSIAAGAAIAVAVADYFVVRNKRNIQNVQQSTETPETPVIIRRPLNEVIETSEEVPKPEGAGAIP